MPTYVDASTGYAKPAMILSVPFRLSVIIICFDGTPASAQKELGFIHTCKFPLGAMNFLIRPEFNRELARHIYEGQKAAIVEAGGQKCNCCGAFADDLVVYPPLSTNLLADVRDGAMVIIDRAFPVCQNPNCHLRLQDLSQKLVACAECRKLVQVESPKLKECVRCEQFYFCCSKKCQKAHSKAHKKQCTASKRRANESSG